MSISEEVTQKMIENMSGTEMKYCPHCKTLKPIDEFHLNKASKDGHQPVCKKCRSELDKIRVEKNREAKKKNAAESKPIVIELEPRQAEKVNVPESIVNRDVIITRDGKRLVKSDNPNKPLDQYTNRELLAEIKKRGYVWENMYIKQTVDYNKI